MFVAMAAISFASCGGDNAKGADSDSQKAAETTEVAAEAPAATEAPATEAPAEAPAEEAPAAEVK